MVAALSIASLVPFDQHSRSACQPQLQFNHTTSRQDMTNLVPTKPLREVSSKVTLSGGFLDLCYKRLHPSLMLLKLHVTLQSDHEFRTTTIMFNCAYSCYHSSGHTQKQHPHFHHPHFCFPIEGKNCPPSLVAIL